MLSKEAQLYVNKFSKSASAGNLMANFIADGTRGFAKILAEALKKKVKKAGPKIVSVNGNAEGRFSVHVSFKGVDQYKSAIEIIGVPADRGNVGSSYNVKFWVLHGKEWVHKTEKVGPMQMSPQILASMAYEYAKNEGVLED